jgi:hypothetical protein
LSLICTIQEYSCKLAAEAIVYAIKYQLNGVPSVSELSTDPCLRTFKQVEEKSIYGIFNTKPCYPRDNNDVVNTNTKPDLLTKYIDVLNQKQINDSELKQKINSHLNNEYKQDSSISSPKEKSKKFSMFTKVYEKAKDLTDWWDTQHKNRVYEKANDLIENEQRNPVFTLSELEYAKNLIKKG